MIRNDTTIKGIPIPTQEVMMMILFVEAMTVFWGHFGRFFWRMEDGGC